MGGYFNLYLLPIQTRSLRNNFEIYDSPINVWAIAKE